MSGDNDLVALILAAGEGTRMKSSLAKVLHTVCGKSMIRFVVEAVRAAAPSRILIVVGHQAEAVRKELEGEGLEFVHQVERLGTGHAAMMARPLLEGFNGTIVVLNGDTPLLRTETLQGLIAFHRERQAGATVLSAELENPAGYGRIIRDGSGNLLRIVEHRDASDEQRAVREINSGIFCFESSKLYGALSRIDRRNVQGEYYITDVIEVLRTDGVRVAAYRSEQREEVLGINDKKQLEAAERLMTGDG